MHSRIKEVIKKQGTTVQELAEKMGISRVGLSQHINGNPSVEVLERIATALRCSSVAVIRIPGRSSQRNQRGNVPLLRSTDNH